MTTRHLISIHDLTASQVAGLYKLAADVKANPKKYADVMTRKSLGMIFEKSSTRTRVSFEVGMVQMGGHALFLSSRDIQLGRGEPISDTAQVLSRYVDGIMARTFAHQTVLDLAKYGSMPVINGLTDDLHPCQALADYFTLRRGLRRPQGTQDRLRRRRQQHGALADVRRLQGGDGHRGGLAQGLRGEGELPGAGPAGRRGRGHQGGRDERSARGGQGRLGGLHRRLGVDGPGGGGPAAAQGLPRLHRGRRP